MLIRDRVLELLEEGDATVTELANRLGALTNTVSKAAARLREDGDAHIAAYVRQAALYRRGPGVDAARPAAPDTVAPAEGRHDAKVRDVQMPVYFELDGGLLPGVKHFTCAPYKATLSTGACADKFRLANSGDAFGRHAHCKRCPIGAAHSGAGPDLNLGTLKGSLMCSRCHRTNGRLIGKRLCISCKNREYEWVKGRNAKNTRPLHHPPLHRLTIGYMAGGKVRTHTVERAVDMTELILDALRGSEHSPSFVWLADPATRALRANPDLDFSISNDVDEVVPGADAAAVADSVQDAKQLAVVPIAASPVAAMPVSVALDVVQADVEADSYGALRDAVEQLEHDTPLSMPTTSRRAAKRLRQQARKQVRVSNVTVGLLRTVGALPPAPPVVVPVPTLQPFYSPSLMSGGAAFG